MNFKKKRVMRFLTGSHQYRQLCPEVFLFFLTMRSRFHCSWTQVYIVNNIKKAQLQLICVEIKLKYRPCHSIENVYGALSDDIMFKFSIVLHIRPLH